MRAVQERSLPGDFPAWQTVDTYFRNWRLDGTWVRMHDHVREWVRVNNQRESSRSEAILDSQSVKTAAMVSEQVGFDAGKRIRGRKRFLTVDTLGLLLRVLVSAANVGERTGGKRVLKRVKRMGKSVSGLTTIWVDGGFGGAPFRSWVMDVCQWIVQLVLPPEHNQGFVLLQKRWVVERTFGWLMGARRLVRDYELLPATSETLIYVAMLRLMLRRLA